MRRATQSRDLGFSVVKERSELSHCHAMYEWTTTLTCAPVHVHVALDDHPHQVGQQLEWQCVCELVDRLEEGVLCRIQGERSAVHVMGGGLARSQLGVVLDVVHSVR